MSEYLDRVVLVTDDDQVIGTMDKIKAHRGKGVLHRAISVFLFRKNNSQLQLLIQKRSQKKIVGAGQWANTVCGNVRPGETYAECAVRRLVEELGIVVEQQALSANKKFQYFAKCNDEFSEQEIDQVFLGWYDDEVTPNSDEVADTAWVNWEELVVDGKLRPMEEYPWAPWFVIMIDSEQIAESINQYLEK